MNPIAVIRIVLLVSIFVSMITTLLFMLPGLYMWLPLVLSILHIVFSIVGLVGVLSTLSTESSEQKDYGWYCTIAHAVAVALEFGALFIAVLYWGISTHSQFKHWYTNGAIVLGIFMAIVDFVTFTASATFIGFVAKEKALPGSFQSEQATSGDL